MRGIGFYGISKKPIKTERVCGAKGTSGAYVMDAMTWQQTDRQVHSMPDDRVVSVNLEHKALNPFDRVLANK